MVVAYLILGSNLGDREGLLKQAIELIDKRAGAVQNKSSVYETASWGISGQPDYLNQTVAIKTSLSPQELLEEVLCIENLLGRERNEKWSSRIIDIDILFYGNSVINTPDLQIPHPHLHKRRFVLEPLHELIPDFIHPSIQASINTLLLELDDDLSVQRIKTNNPE